MGNGASVASSGSGASEEGKDFNLTGNQTLDKQHRGLFEKIDKGVFRRPVANGCQVDPHGESALCLGLGGCRSSR